jgi:hypothetical protein
MPQPINLKFREVIIVVILVASGLTALYILTQWK